MGDLLRALGIAAIVGTLLAMIHCPDHVAHHLLPFCSWKIGLSYLVPFVVSLVSAQLVRRRGPAT